jgi:hypothetical protein
MNVIVISDLRTLPVAAAISLRKKLYNGNALLLTSDAICKGDYGTQYSNFYKYLKISILRLFFGMKVLNSKSDVEFCPEDSTGMMSSLYSITDDSLADPLKYPLIWSQLKQVDIGARSIIDYIFHKNIKSISIFNGRLASSYPIVKYAKRKGIEVFFYEYGRAKNRRLRPDQYTLTNFPIHDLNSWGVDLVDLRERSKNKAKADVGSIQEFKTEKLSNKFTSSYSITEVPKHDLGIFLTSSHEFKAINEDICGKNMPSNEIEFIKQVIAKHGNNLRYAVRCHPNQANDKSWVETLREIEMYCEENGVSYYSPNSAVSSYALIENCKLVAVDISSIGVDALLLGKPVDIYGYPDYRCAFDKAKLKYGNDIEAIATEVAETLSFRQILHQHELTMVAKIWYFVDRGCSRIWRVIQNVCRVKAS